MSYTIKHWASICTSWWHHEMETFSLLLAIFAGHSPVSGQFDTQRPATRSLDVFFHQCPNKRLSKQSSGWWFKMNSPPLWRHSNVITVLADTLTHICARSPTTTERTGVWCCYNEINFLQKSSQQIDGILPKGPYPPCLCMADRALLAWYPWDAP